MSEIERLFRVPSASGADLLEAIAMNKAVLGIWMRHPAVNEAADLREQLRGAEGEYTEVISRADADALARAVSASLTHGEQGPLADALSAYLAKHPWEDL